MLQFCREVAVEGVPMTEAVVTADAPLQFQESAQNAAGGTMYNQSLRVVIDQEGNEIVGYVIPRRTVVAVLSDNEERYIWGDENVPVLMTVTPAGDKYILDFSRSSSLPLQSFRI